MDTLDRVSTLVRLVFGEQVGEPFETPHTVMANGEHRLLKR